MIQLLNYYPLPGYEKELRENYNDLHTFLDMLNMDGIEHLIYDLDNETRFYPEFVKGVHLKYWPSWVDFYLHRKEKNNQGYKAFFSKEETVDAWVEKIRQHLRFAQSYNALYYVWHVAEASDKEIFTYQFSHSDELVLDVTAELFNEVSSALDPSTLILFENLWWPGLKLTEPHLVERFFSQIKHKNVGIILDTGHLMNTNSDLCTEDEAIDYILSCLQKLGSLKSLIKGLHFSCSLSRNYVQSFFRQVPDPLDIRTILKHVNAIDQHRAFSSDRCRYIVDSVEPMVLNHELIYSTLAELEVMVRQQRNALGY